MSRQLKISVGIIGLFVLVVAGLVAFGVASEDDKKPAASNAPSSGAPDARLVRPDSHVLGEKAKGDVTFVEFLDFECEGCKAAYPAVEQLRKDYKGRVTFVARYFPMPGHFNAERAARSVEAAAQQGKFEDMYHHMYRTQDAWGEKQIPLDRVFRTYARDLGLDMKKYDADYADPATVARVKKDMADGYALGVAGTPTFFLDGELIQPRSYKDLTDAVDAALAG